MKEKKYIAKKHHVEKILNEPQISYPAQKLGDVFKTITISTTEEQSEEMRQYSASLSYVQRMAYLYDLICRAYGHVLNNSSEDLWDKTIYIDQK
jgi:hypothetical protein